MVLAELERILSSPHFCNSKRYPALLQYIVQHALSGDVEQLKERTLGIEVFHRSPGYDTNADTVVRYTAGEVRKRLALYYHESEGGAPIQIVLPVGSYVPEFLRAAQDEPGTKHAAPGVEPAPDLDPVVPFHIGEAHPPAVEAPAASAEERHPSAPGRAWAILAVLAVVLAAGVFAFFHFRSPAVAQRSAVDSFWLPVLEQPGTALICSGAVVFAPERFSGTMTANKDNQYPFVSIQIASTIARISGLLERHQVNYQMQPCTSTSLNELRNRPLILLGGYNNDWTIRLVEPLRFNFVPGGVESIADRNNPRVQWQRNPNQPYSSADDYGLIARFHDPTTDSMVVVVAGLGRNGTEAAGLFSTTEHYMDLLEKNLGSSLASGNIEAVIKVNVVDGKTGAPALEDAARW